MARIDEYTLGTNATFQQRCVASALDYIRNTIATEAVYDIQTLSVSGTPTGGTFTLGGGPLTGVAGIPYNATSRQVEAALNANLAPGNTCACSGGPLPGTGVMIVWDGNLSQSAQNILTVGTNSLTGGSSPAPSVAHTVVGVSSLAHPLHVAFAEKVIVNPTAFLYLGMLIAGDANVIADYLAGSSVQTAVTDAHIDSAVAAQFNLWSGAI